MTGGDAAPSSRSTAGFWVSTGVFSTVLLLRLIALTRFVSESPAEPSSGDIAFYHQWAQRILSGHFTDGEAFYALPLYAYWLAGVYAVVGVSAFVPGLLQCVADAGTALLVFWLSEKAFASMRPTGVPGAQTVDPTVLPHGGTIIGGLAAAAWAFYVPAQTFSIVRMPTALGVFAYWLVVWQVVRRDKAPSLPILFLVGLLIGVTAMGVATVLFIAPLVIAALLFKWRSRRVIAPAQTAVAIAIFASAILIGTAPCWLHNTVVARDRVFLSAHSGINFWIGNNPEATGYPRFGEVRAGQADMLRDSVRLAEAAAGRSLKRSEVSAHWSGRARAYIAADFGSWTRLLGTKMWNFWNAFQYDDLSIVSRLREQGITLPGFGFGVVAATALAGLPFVLRGSSAARWIFSAVVLQMLSLLPVFITERYRLAAVPGLVVLAVVGLSCFWRFCLLREFGRMGAYLALLGAAAFLVSSVPATPGLWALDPYNAGREALAAGDLTLAERKLQLAYAYVPENAELNFALGNLHLTRRDPQLAKQFYAQTLQLDREHAGAFNNLGLIAMEEERWDVAANLFRRSLQREPNDARTRYLLAKALLASGDVNGARSELARALEISPEQREFQQLRDEIAAQTR